MSLHCAFWLTLPTITSSATSKLRELIGDFEPGVDERLSAFFPIFGLGVSDSWSA